VKITKTIEWNKFESFETWKSKSCWLFCWAENIVGV